MARAVLGLGLSAFSAVCCFAQTGTESPHFEVASVKASAPPGSGGRRSVGISGGPGTSDPTRVRIMNVALIGIVTIAYGLDIYRVSGPAWISQQPFDITATMPAGTSKEQFRTMLQNLLAERFHLVTHRESRTVSAYWLEVGKNGSKLEAAKAADPAEDAASSETRGPLAKDKEGYPELPLASSSMAIVTNAGHSTARLYARGEPVAWLVKMLSGQLQTPVIDSTGLTGIYDFTMSWIPQRALTDDEEFGPGILTAVQAQLGLRLVSRKGPIEMLIIDAADKVPTGNRGLPQASDPVRGPRGHQPRSSKGYI